MNPLNLLFEPLALGPLRFVLFFAWSYLALVFSMILVANTVEGANFGAFKTALLKALGIVTVVTIVQAFTCGILLTGLIWFVSMNFVFELEKRQRRYLAQINWFMSGLGKLLIVILLSNPR